MLVVDTLTRVSSLLNITLGTIMFVSGVIGSIFIGLIFFTQRTFRTNPGIHYLLAGTVANFLMLINVLLPRIIAEGFALPLYNVNATFCRQRLYISGVASVCGVYFPCWAVFDQYACSSRNPLFRQRWSSIKFARQMVLLTVSLSALIHVPHLIWNGIENSTCMSINIRFTIYIAYAFVPLVYGLIPLLLIGFFTLNLTKNLRLTMNLGAHHYLAKQIHRMLIPQLIILAISYLPFSIQAAYALSTKDLNKDSIRLAVEDLIYHLVRLLFFCNYCCTFYIYVYMSRAVRKNLCRLISRLQRANQVGVVPINP